MANGIVTSPWLGSRAGRSLWGTLLSNFCLCFVSVFSLFVELGLAEC